MKPKKLNKAIDSGIDKVLNEGFTVKVTIPGDTLFLLGLTVVISTLIIFAAVKIFNKQV